MKNPTLKLIVFLLFLLLSIMPFAMLTGQSTQIEPSIDSTELINGRSNAATDSTTNLINADLPEEEVKPVKWYETKLFILTFFFGFVLLAGSSMYVSVKKGHNKLR